ncbi:MAG TPA: 1-acyl-sn-glycerol-3-phosphate acyltransferase [Caulobacteraceae bacterium]|jgi:putative hemolysin|nr:1-acyl-sn-glycerol-3-phosphate acyltransferase [Caulobacteraceae bacterium]
MAATLDLSRTVGAARAGGPHIVDELIAERAPRLSASWAWPMARPLLYRLLDYRKARAMADHVASVGGREAMAYASELLGLRVLVTGLERLPAKGRVVIVANHPTGLADGVAVDDAIRPVRPDRIYFANADARRISIRLDEIFIPVEWVEAKRTRETIRVTLRRAQEALEGERALVIFPAGRISRRRNGVLRDLDWAPSALSLARRHHAPVLPIHLAGPPSRMFRLFDRFSDELRDITLFHELLNKQGGEFRLTIGPLIPADALADPAETTARLKAYVESVLPLDPDQPFA